MKRRERQQGIPNLDLKLEVCCKLIGAMTYRELVDKVLKNHLLAGQVYDRLLKWGKNRPVTSEFWDQLAVELDCDGSVTGALLIDAKIDRFIDFLPPDRQERARQIVADLGSHDDQPASPPESTLLQDAISALGFGNSNVIWLQHMGPVQTVATGLRAGKIDQRHYYLDPDSANGWSRLVRSEAYPTYDHCKTALQALVESAGWNQSLRAGQPSTVVMLAGGGAPTKDLLLLRSLLAQPYVQGCVHYYLVDISLWMLRESALWIRENWQTIDGFERIVLRPVHQDVLEMTSRHRELFHEQGKVVFGITGGTLGNLSEETFFRSLDTASDDGDLLIVSADTIDDLPSDTVARRLTDKYDNPALRRFIRPVVRAVLSESDARETVDSALKRIKVTLRPGGEANASDVPQSWSVIVTLEHAGREVTLVTSTRYKSSELMAFARGFGWQEVCQISSPLNPDYKQYLLCRNKAESRRFHLFPD
jgi:uncharacterized SAM-dependent methyltransferase